ncbi:hypothetical protein U879_16075 [Defluviimonas sp. 20V17]|uniref:FlgN protein n=1 Tax=Allgaiera indica TaxID=765699 RepID=A0AAN4ZZA8_9RHOB|nr:hypothetical protein [Allgaiera indica]KDB02711.1 hypothetical protein U879_16075 [Defluviimonas sp. 20V17]GHE01744.1 hypothetical protein GCM10008024_18710 [Allgaiera indica]SDW93813.1 hypothetical protein SAMN05444006_10875 [Allgaiera indica]
MAGHDPIARLGALLDEEAEALRCADFAALAALTQTKAELTAQVEAIASGDSPELAALADKARRNAASLRAAIAGVRAARLRVGELARAAQGTATYDCQGRKSLHPAGPGRADHRA